MAAAPTQPDPPEGPRDEDAATHEEGDENQGHSATDPAEGSPDDPAAG